MTRALSFAALLGHLCACRAPVYLEAIEPPSEVRYLAAVAVDGEQGQVLGGSAIVPRDAQWRVELRLADDALEASQIELVGWSTDPYPALTFPAPREPDTLRAAGECETRVPAPVWSAAVRGEPMAAWPALTTPLLASSCPTLIEAGRAEPIHLCGRNYCGQSIEQDGCAIDLRIGGCGFERSLTRGVVDAYGQLCFFEKDACRTVEGPSAVYRRIECSEPELCAIDWVRSSSTTPPLSITSRTIVPMEPTPVMAETAQPSEALFGPLQGLAVAGERVLVLRRDALRTRFGESAPLSDLLTLDPDTLSTRAEVPLPAGVAAMEAAPDEQSLIALQLADSGSGASVLRLDLDGQVLEQRPLGELPFEHQGSVYLFAYVAELNAFVAFFRVFGGARIATIDPESLRTLSVCTTELELRPTDVIGEAPDLLWFSDNGNDYLPRLRVSNCESTGGMAMETPGNFGMGFFLRPPGSEQVHLTLAGISINAVSTGVLESGKSFPARGGSFFEAFMVPTRLALDPSRPGLALAAVHTAEGVGPSRIAWFDLEARVFLPGARELPRGMVALMRTSGNGVFYLTMGRSGDVVRVDTR